MRTVLIVLLALLPVLTPATARARVAGGKGAGAPDSLRTIMLAPALPGAVVTTVVEVPRRKGDRALVRYLVEATSAVRLFGAGMGVVPAGSGPIRLPLTFTVTRDQHAGPLLVAKVLLSWPDGTTYTAELRLDVQTVRKLRLSALPNASITAGNTLSVPYRLVNLGNAVDTLQLSVVALPQGWKAVLAEPSAFLAPSAAAEGTLRVRIPRETGSGGYLVTLRAAGLGDTVAASTGVQVAEAYSAGGVQLPSLLFLGAPDLSDRSGEPQMALLTNGVVDGTRISLIARRADQSLRAPAFTRYAVGPELFLGLDNPRWGLHAGDIMTPYQGPMRMYGFGTGASVRWHGATVGDLYAARPREFGQAPLDGHLLRGLFGLTVGPGGALTLRLTDYARPLRAGLAEDRTQSATLAYESGQGGRQQLSLEAGVGRAAAVGDSRQGPTFEANYSVASDSGAFLAAHASYVPGVVPGGQGANEAYLGGTLPLGSLVQALAYGSRSSVPVLGVPTSSRTDVASGLKLARGLNLALLQATYARTDASSSLITGGSWSQYGVKGSGQVDVGHFLFGVQGETGEVQAEGERLPLRNASAHLEWHSRPATLWVGSTYSEGRFGTLPLMINAGVHAQAAGIQLDGAAGAYLPVGAKAYLGEAWAGLNLPLVWGLGAVAGVEYRPWEAVGHRTRISLGFTQSFGLPVPLPRPAAAAGAVFEDRNGNGRRDPGEPFLSGVGMLMGNASASTDARGHFAFPHGTPMGRGLRVDLGSLSAGWLTENIPTTGRGLEIPLFRAGSLKIRLVEQGAADDSLAAPVSDVWIDLVDGEGRERSAVSDHSGYIYFGALPPGEYTLTAHPVTDRGQALPVKVVKVTVPYGAATEVRVPVPSGHLEIRFQRANASPPGPR